MQRYTTLTTEQILTTQYYFDVVYDRVEEEYSAWLFREDIGIKMHVYGRSTTGIHIEDAVKEFEKYILNNHIVYTYSKQYLEGGE